LLLEFDSNGCEIAMTTFQQVRFSLAVETPSPLDISPLLTIFSRWRLEESPMRWVDLADYAHVPVGPAALLVGKRGNLSLERDYHSAALVYRNRRDLEGDAANRLRASMRRGLALFRRLVSEREFPGAITVVAGQGSISWPDRVSVPNDEDSRIALEEPVGTVLDDLYGKGQHRWEVEANPEQMLGFRFQANRPFSLQELEGRP
jgi:hypothetical protein